MTEPQLPPPYVPPIPQAPRDQGPATHQQPPPGAFVAPVGGYSAPVGGYRPPTPGPRSSLLGTLALVLALVAAVVTPAVAGFAAYEIGRRIPGAVELQGRMDSLEFLSPARDQVLWGELAFWIGTLLGIAAIVAGIIAIVKHRGRGQGVAAVIIAAVAPGVFAIVLSVAFGLGAASGAVSLYA